MKKALICLSMIFACLTWVSAQETIEVKPSDQVIYPDSSQVLNKTAKAGPLPAVPLASNKPVLAAAPVAAAGGAARPTVPPAPAAHGWFLRWTLTADEAGAKAWAAALGRPAVVSALSADLWEVLTGPLSSEGLQTALGQPGAQLVRR